MRLVLCQGLRVFFAWTPASDGLQFDVSAQTGIDKAAPSENKMQEITKALPFETESYNISS